MTIRAQAETKVAEQVGDAAIKEHETGYETLYVCSDGRVFWDCQPDGNTWLQGAGMTSIYRTGTGSCPCNCDDCQNGIDPSDWADTQDNIGDLADVLQDRVDELKIGFFDDEDAEK